MLGVQQEQWTYGLPLFLCFPQPINITQNAVLIE